MHQKNNGQRLGADLQARSVSTGAQCARAVSPARRRLFRVGLALLVPLALLALVEIVLRLGGYGFHPHFFKPERIGGADYLVENDKFGLRFFPPWLARSPSPVIMPARKQPGTCRIFILGESAAQGDPRPAYGAGRYLQTLLRERFPEAHFEVVCVAMTAVNSHAIRVIAAECARYEGDLWILYLGNNEMIGPFGATSVLGTAAPPLPIVRLNLSLQESRFGQLLVALGRKLRKSPPEAAGAWGGMEMWVRNQVPPADPRKEVVYVSFQRNLEDVLRTGLNSGARIVLSTTAVNLRDCPPFASLPAANLAAVDRAACERFAQEAATALGQTNLAKAAECLARAGRLDSQRADLQFRLAECLAGLADASGAALRFRAARDLDALPFRADSRINSEIERLGRRYEGPKLAFFDAEELFERNCPAGVPGQESFYEHVHFNFDGNYRLARAWAEQADRLLSTNLTGKPAGEWASQEVCERRLALTDWNRAGVIEDVIRRLSQPPLSAQLNHVRRVEAFRAWLKELRVRMTREAIPKARQFCLEALALAPRDHRLHENFAEFLEAVGDWEQAAVEWRQVAALIPHHHVAYFQSGRLRARQGRLAEAQTDLTKAVELRPDLSEGWFELGKLRMAEGKPAHALEDLERARRLLPQDDRVYYHMGKALSKLARQQEAITSFRRALELRPDYWEARYALGEELAFSGQEPEARRTFEAVIREKPDHAMAHFNLGVALWQEGRRQEALARFKECARLDPHNKLAREYVEKIEGLGTQN